MRVSYKITAGQIRERLHFWLRIGSRRLLLEPLEEGKGFGKYMAVTLAKFIRLLISTPTQGTLYGDFPIVLPSE